MNRIDKVRRLFEVEPREKEILPSQDSVMPIFVNDGYDVVEYCDGEEVDRHPFGTKEEARLFAQHEQQAYLDSLGDERLKPNWTAAMSMILWLVITVVCVRGCLSIDFGS